MLTLSSKTILALAELVTKHGLQEVQLKEDGSKKKQY